MTAQADANVLCCAQVRSRMESESGISFTEFTYQLLQGYDFVHLARSHGVRMQVRAQVKCAAAAALADNHLQHAACFRCLCVPVHATTAGHVVCRTCDCFASRPGHMTYLFAWPPCFTLRSEAVTSGATSLLARTSSAS